MEFTYINSYHTSIEMAPFKALYDGDVDLVLASLIYLGHKLVERVLGQGRVDSG